MRQQTANLIAQTHEDRWAWKAAVCIVLFAAGLLAVAVWQAGSLRVGLYFVGGLAATGVVLYASAAVLTYLLRRTGNLGPFAVRQAINSLYRPGNQTRIILLAVGLGALGG